MGGRAQRHIIISRLDAYIPGKQTLKGCHNGWTCGLDVEAGWLDVDAIGKYADAVRGDRKRAGGVTDPAECKRHRRNCQAHSS